MHKQVERVDLAHLPGHLLDAVVDRSCHLQLVTHASCKQVAASRLPVTALRLDAERSQHVTALRSSWLLTIKTMSSLVTLELTR